MKQFETGLRQRILFVEDEAALARAFGDTLRATGYSVDACGDGARALEAATETLYDLIVLDLMLPSMSGYEVSGALRRRGIDTPILMLTARDELADKVAGFRAGADDYVTKPFDAEELLARIEALLRRTSRQIDPQLRSYEFGGLKVDFANNKVVRDGHAIDLAEQEARLLRFFIEHRRKVVSRDTLLREVWGYRAVPFTRTVDVHISWLRQKVEPDPKCPQFIVTVHGKGYRFEG